MFKLYFTMTKSIKSWTTLLIISISIRSYKSQTNPFYNQQDPQYHEQNPDFRRPNDYNNGNNQFNRNQPLSNNPYNQDPYNRYNSSNSNNPNDRYNRYDPNDPYNRDRNNSFNPYNQDAYNRNNYSNDPNDRYNRYNDPNNPNNRDRNNSFNPYNQDPNNRNFNNDRDRYNNSYNQDPYNRDNNFRYNQDPYNRNNNSRYNQDPYNRDNNSRYNQDPNNRYNQNPYNQGQNPYNNDQYNRNNPYDRNDPYRRNEDQYNRYNTQNPNQRNPYNQDPNSQNRDDRFGGQNRQLGGTQYGGQNDPNENCCEEYCLQRDENPYLYFGTKTGYQVVYGKKYGNQLSIPDCTPIQIWMINRHGTSLPTTNEIMRLRDLEKLKNEIILNYEERQSYPYRGRLCSEDLNNLRRWRWNDSISERNEKSLTQQGIEDERYFAARLRSKFGNLLNQQINDQTYNFQYDQNNNNYKSNHDTYQAFIEGLFEKQAFMVHANTNGNAHSSSQGYCKTWREYVENNNHTYSEYERFKQRPEYKQLIRDVYRRLGFKFSLDESKIRDMYDMCRYEKAWNIQEPSPWCSVFTKNQLLLLEYAEDLAEYYYSGYGNEVNAQVGCSFVKDMFEMFERTVNGDTTGYKVASYFTRSTEFLQVLTAMGIARDYPGLNADNFYQQSRRQWKTSVIDPFGANLVAVLYHCQREKSYKVMFLNNEVPVNYPDCSLGLCDWFTVQEKFQRIVDRCNKNYCEDGKSSARTVRNFAFIIILTAMFNLLLF